MTDAFDQTWRQQFAQTFGSEGFEMSDTLEERARELLYLIATNEKGNTLAETKERISENRALILTALQEAEARGRRKGLEEAATKLFADADKAEGAGFCDMSDGVAWAAKYLRTLAQEDKP